jgi:HEAT repeat protein
MDVNGAARLARRLHRGEPGVIWILDRLLRHRDEVVRAHAAAALGKIGDKAAASSLRGVLTDISPRVRASAATALGAAGGKDAAEWIGPLREDRRPEVRMAAAAAVRRLTHRA